MKVVQINSTCATGSTGKICYGISQCMTRSGIENYILYTVGKSNYHLGIKMASDSYIKMQAAISHLRGNYGFNSILSTKRMIEKLKQIQPELVHLHNIHSHDCNLEMLLSYLKENHIKLIWTLHDCWLFTAYCPHFIMAKCDRWMSGCKHCPQVKDFSLFFDRSKQLYQKKKELLFGLDLTIVTPSQWLADMVGSSFLKSYPVKVINNGIDLSVFRPTESDFRTKFGISPENKVLLGVAFDWGTRKGLDVFQELAERLDRDTYQIVLVGIDKDLEKKVSSHIVCISRTQNQQELATIYSSADVFVNPTREENYPTVNMEALACGTPVVTFHTGGSPEMLDETCGSVVDCDDIDALEKEIIRICEERPYSEEACLKKAKEFDKNERFKEYIELYERIDVAGAERDRI